MKNVYTIQELQNTKLYELPNVLYNAILHDLQNVFHTLTSRLLDILNNAIVTELDQYCNIYKYIIIIA